MPDNHFFELPPVIHDAICKGDAVLFLGAGANQGAINRDGREAPDGNGLKDAICENFLGGRLKDKPLHTVAELAKNEADLRAVQEFIRTLFANINPNPYHQVIARFRWRAIVTTNFDYVIERAYQAEPNPMQDAFPVVKDSDVRRFGKTVNTVPLVKLHGSLDVIDDPKHPLILAAEEYAKYYKNRQELFGFFRDLARDSHLLFCGYDISDTNIAQILWDLGSRPNERPMYLTVNPNLSDVEQRYWQARRITPIASTFEQFLSHLDKVIKPASRTLGTLLGKSDLSIKRFIASHEEPSQSLTEYLENHIAHVYQEMPASGVNPTEFYRGLSVGWASINQCLDVRRRVTDDLEQEIFFDGLPDNRQSKLALLKGHAGSGKSITLKRAIWDGVTEYSKPCFRLRADGALLIDPLREMCSLFKERIYVLVDDIVSHLDEFYAFYSLVRRDDLPITVIAGARVNEWSVGGGPLEPFVDAEFDLRDLSEREIDALIQLLREHNVVPKSDETAEYDIKTYFKVAYKRQLLVALHEVTSGKRFEEIILNEYNNILPEEARYLYLDVCTLNRFHVGVRAGLIARLTGVAFPEFSKRLLSPLDRVVFADKDPRSRDYAYRARHPLIAKYVFDQVLTDPTVRADHLARVVRAMNTAYQSDAEAFQKIISGDRLARLFLEKAKATQIFEAALDSGANESHVFHQWAVFELKHVAGSPKQALEYINRAQYSDAGRRSEAILHTRAMILYRLAKDAKSQLEKQRYLRDAKTILEEQLRSKKANYAYVTLGNIFLDELVDLLDEGDHEADTAFEREVWHRVMELETYIFDARQRFPDDPYFDILEARYAEAIDKTPKATTALERAFKKNPGSGFVATRLAKQYAMSGRNKDARRVLHTALQSDPTEKRANLLLARLLIDEDEREHKEDIFTLLGRSFTDGDSNYDAQFWYARQSFLYGNKADAERIYKRMRRVPMGPDLKNRWRGIYRAAGGEPMEFEGRVLEANDNYCFIRCAGFRENIFCYHHDVQSDWDAIGRGSQVTFFLAFSMLGPRAVECKA
ncbi:MAG: SIR2 family protein [Gammaproteobacteria bacterium]